MNTVLKPRTKEKKYFLMEVTAQGVYPSLWINDISSDGYVKSLLWELFDINNFNNLIRKIFIDKELNEEIEENKVLIDQNNYESQTNNCMSQVLCQFGYVIIGSPCTDIYVNFNNNGVVPVEWKFQFPNDFQNDIEKWAKGEVMSEEQLKLNMILDNQLFSIVPKNGYLLPGESVNVKFTYKHEIVGTHRLPVILKIQNGSITETKDLIVTLYGCTIPLNKKYIMFPSMQHRFKDVSISTSYPPIQQYFLRNCGSTNIEYMIDTSPLEKLKKENYNFDILKCNNSSGIIYPGETQYTEWIFKPLEAKEYSVDIPIHIKDGQTKIITFTGRGIRYTMPYSDDTDLEDPLREENNDHISHKQLLKIPNQIVVLSDERIHFGHVPTGSILRRIITIKNISTTERVSFTWNIKDDQDEIKITPKLGTLEPGQSQLCKIRFKPCNQSKVYSLNIGCIIVNLTKMEKYYIKKREVEEVIKKKKYLRKLSLNLLTDKNNDFSVSVNKLNYNIRKTKYNPLPPIGSNVKINATESDIQIDEGSQRSQSSIQCRSDRSINNNSNCDPNDINTKINDFARNDFPELPKAPNPSTISIEIISESHEPFEYKKHYKNYDNYYFEKESFEKDNSILDDDSMSVVFSTVQFILNNILQDLEIQNLTNHLKFETLPYFSQIRAITKPELCTFDADAEVQKVETSKIDNIIVSSYGMVDNSYNNEVFKKKNAFKPRINSYINVMPKIKNQMSNGNSNPSVMFLEDDYMDVYGLGDESILKELTALETEEALKHIQCTVVTDESQASLHSSISYSHSSINNDPSKSQNDISCETNEQDNQNNESTTKINNTQSQSNVQFNSVHSSTVNISADCSASHANNSNNHVNKSINKSESRVSQSNQNLSNSNPEIDSIGSYSHQSSSNSIGSNSVGQSYSSISSQCQSQENIDNNNHDDRSHTCSHINSLIASNSALHTDPLEPMDSTLKDSLIFPEVADGQILEIIQNND